MRRCLLLFLLGIAAFAQPNLFLLPSASSPTPAITPFQVNPFFAGTDFPAQAAAAFFFVSGDGSKYYSVARSGADTVLVLSAASPSTVLRRHSLASAEAAVMTPDRRRLLVVAGGLHILDTATDNILSTITDVGTNPIDVAVALDASRAFVLSSTSNRLTAVDLTTNTTVGNPITIPGICTGVATGYNGLIYVSATNRIYEIDGRFMTIRTEFPLNARPGKVAFTPDLRYGVMVNQTPFTGSSVILIDLVRRIVAGTIPNFQVTLDSLIVGSSNRVYAVSNQRQAMYEISLNPLTINAPEFQGLPAQNTVFAAIASNEAPNPRYLFVRTPTSLLRLDNSVSPPAGSGAVAIPSGGAFLAFAEPKATGAPTQIVAYNNVQTSSPGVPYLPLYARVFNASGQPLEGIPVTFVSDTTSEQIETATVTTNASGYAMTTVIASGNSGMFSVLATIGNSATAPRTIFTFFRSGLPDSLTVVRGQGQSVQEQFQIREPMVVQVRDADGRPAANRTITFAIVTGNGTFTPTTADGTVLAGVTCSLNVCDVRTDADGRAAIGFIASSVDPGSSFSQQIISATNRLSSVTFTLTTFLGQSAGGGAASPPFVQRLAPTGTTVITGTVGATLPAALRLRVLAVSGPQAGQGIPSVMVRALTGNLPAAGPTADCSTLTDSTGVATCNLLLGPTGGVASLSVIVGESLSLGGPSLSVNVSGGPPVSNIAPFSSQGATKTFTVNVSHPDGLARLGIINLLINSSLDARNACYLAYSVPQRVLYLVNDAGPAGGLSPGLVIGSPNTGSIANTQCRIFAEGSAAVANGNTLTLTLNTSFTANFAGSKVTYIATRTTDELTQGWVAYGVHEVPIPSPTFPNSSPTIPGSGSTQSNLTTFTYRDGTTSANLQTLWGLVNTSLDARNACYFAYHAPSNSLFLFPNDGDGTQATSIILTAGNSIENSQCKINASNSSVETAGNTLSLTLNLTYKPAFAGPKIIWTAASTLSNLISPWKASGAWQVPF